MTTASEVAAVWARIAALNDPIDGDPIAIALLRNPEEEQAPIAQAIEHMKGLDAAENGLLTTMGYEFCLERELWRRGIEAILQARALQQILVWVQRFPAHRPLLEGVVLRHTFYAGFRYPTPALRPFGGFNFVLMPYVYQELLLLPAAALAELFPAPVGGDVWSFITEDRPLDLDGVPVPRQFRKLVARIVTSEVFDPNEDNEYPIAVLSRSKGWFGGVDDHQDPGSLETVFGYSGQDFAIAHELGHLLAPSAAGSDTYLQGEVAADAAGFRLFALSWGWRDEVIEECPLSEQARTFIGPIWFFFTARLLYAVRQELKTRVSHAFDVDLDFLGHGEEEEHLSTLAQRWASLHQLLGNYVDSLMEFGGTFNADDGQRIARLVGALDAFNRQVPVWLADMPDESLLEAVRLVHPAACPRAAAV